MTQGKALIDASVDPADPRLQAIKDVLGMLYEEGGKLFNPIRLEEISKTILFWIDRVEKQ